MGFAISLEYFPCRFGFHSMYRAFFVAKVFHSACPEIILAEVESVNFIYNLDLPKWVSRLSFSPELTVGNNTKTEKKFSGREECEKQILCIKKKTADIALKKAKHNLQILKNIKNSTTWC